MSQFQINSITDKSGTSGPVIAGVSTNNSTGCMIIPAGPTSYRGNRGRGIIAGGYQAPGQTNSIEYITISTLGNGSDFGDLDSSSGCYGTSGKIMPFILEREILLCFLLYSYSLMV